VTTAAFIGHILSGYVESPVVNVVTVIAEGKVGAVLFKNRELNNMVSE
jgi:hypothetical protein